MRIVQEVGVHQRSGFRVFVLSYSRSAAVAELSIRASSPVQHGQPSEARGPRERDTPMAASPRKFFGPFAYPTAGAAADWRLGTRPAPRTLEIAVTTLGSEGATPPIDLEDPGGRAVSFAVLAPPLAPLLAPCSHPLVRARKWR